MRDIYTARVHYDNGEGKAACRPNMYKPELTARPSKVTCGGCKNSNAYKEMMGE
jgi:hypothetical protein